MRGKIPKWRKNIAYENKNVMFLEKESKKYADFSPIELFELFFDDEVFDLLVTETRKYAYFKGNTDPNVSREELQCFIAILIISGYSNVPGKRCYWDSGDDTRNVVIYNDMRRNRFETIMKYLHLADNLHLNKNDKYAKIRPLD